MAGDTRKVGLTVVGDVGPRRKDPSTMFAEVASAIHEADVAFCQLEPVLTERGYPVPQARLAMRTPPSTASAIAAAGFDVVSFASNHCMDFGATGLFDTVQAIEAAGMRVAGVGNDIAAARAPVIVQANGVSFAFIACCSILPMGYWAEEHRPGCRPMRAWTQYRLRPGSDPGAVPDIETFIHAEDRARLIEDIARAREQVDHVIVSMHWGIHFVPGDIADYQRQIAHAAIDAGASLVVGHHPHVLKGIERYRDGLILYSLGNFALEGPAAFAPNLHASHGFQEIKSLARQWDAKTLLPADAYRSLMVSCEFAAGGLQRALLRPVYLRADAEPYLPQPSEPQCAEVLDYLDECCRSQHLPIPYRRGDGYATIDF